MNSSFRIRKWLISGFLLLLFALYFVVQSLGDIPSYPKRSVEYFSKKYETSFVSLSIYGKQQKAASGFFIEWNGTLYILTNKHPLTDHHKIEITLFNGQSVPAELIALDPSKDVAILQSRLPVSVTPLPFYRSSPVPVGEKVFSIGNPLGIGASYFTGIVSAQNRTFDLNGTVYKDLIQTTIPMSGGSSGGPLIDFHGKVIGMNTAYLSNAEGVSFSIPASHIQESLAALLEKK